MANTTWNPADKTANITLSGSNLTATSGATGTQAVRAVDRQISGKYYWECTIPTVTNVIVGATNGSLSLSSITPGGTVGAVWLNHNGTVVSNGAGTAIVLGALSNGVVVGIAVDCDAQLIWFRAGAAGNWNANATYNPATGVGGLSITYLGRTTAVYPLAGLISISGSSVTANFGDTGFSGAVPSGFTSGFPTPSSPNIASATQTALEQWAQGTPQAQLTQVAAEMWASSGTGTTQALMTQIAIEQWSAAGVAAQAAQARAVILA